MPSSTRWLWWLALSGEFLLVFAVVALSGPGRIDIVDGQTRFEVGRSLVERGDSIIRDDRIWFGVFPGRDGDRYTDYRIPQTLLAVPAIMLADTTGPLSEGRRHFFFVLTSAWAAGVLALTYTLLFRHFGLTPARACGWGLAGVFCTPAWFYGTSTFDDILGTATVVAALATALATRRCRPLLGALAAGLLVGLAFNCKQPLGVFVLPVLAAQASPDVPLRRQWGRFVLILLGLAAGIAFYQGYQWAKFPVWGTEEHKLLFKRYVPVWTPNPVPGLAAFALSPGAGVFWYFPPVVLCYFGLKRWWETDKLICAALFTALGVYVLFHSFLTIFKGDPSWGPRYLTPIFGSLWIFAPASARLLRSSVIKAFLLAGLTVQLLALSVDAHRLYIQRGLPSGFGVVLPWLYFHPSASHLVDRPREIIEIAFNKERAPEFTPSPSPTFAFPVIDELSKHDHESVRRYHILNSFRPWWASQWYLPPDERPVDLARTAALLLLMAAAGGGLMWLGLRGQAEPADQPTRANGERPDADDQPV